MIVTTTPSVEGRTIVSYGGIVFGEVVAGVDFIRDMTASFRTFFGGRSKAYEEGLTMARENAIDEMSSRAEKMGADAVVGVKVDYEVMGEDNSLFLVTVSGTAVKLN